MAPPWATPAAVGGGLVALVALAFLTKPAELEEISVAFIGNSMIYFNDLPRFMEALSANKLTQNSCLHGGATIRTMLATGNGMYKKWSTANALVPGYEDEGIHDFGACTVHQLMFGFDSRLYYDDDDNTGENDDALSYSYYEGINPCHEDENYLPYLEKKYALDPPKWDFVVLNDNTRSPARNTSRQTALEKLENSYVDWFNATGAIPVFLCTHAYWTEWRNMSGLVDVPTFTSLTYEGYRQYAKLLQSHLPEWQKPRLAPVNIAFLTVWEENYAMWEQLFHIDEVHASPHGTFLTGCVIYYTLFGRMPTSAVALRENMSRLWLKARRMQPESHKTNPIPTRQEAQYLYEVADRVMRKGHIPRSFTFYENGEVAPDVIE